MKLDDLLSLAIEGGASDLHLNPGRPPILRVSGELHEIDAPILDDQSTGAYAKELCDEAQWAEVEKGGTSDFGIAHGNGNRFRVSVLRQRGRISAVLRLIPSELLSLDEIGLPTAVRELLTRPRGLILVTGPTGSGKTTTLASMVNWINTELDRHIVTIEDPIEYYHEHKRGVVTQREIGTDVPNFPEAIRRALRQDPDVILVGEMRDLETISAAITAAETGHLVFGTLHTTGSATTVNRIIDAFPANQQEQIRSQLSVSILSVVSQVLLPRASSAGRKAAFEVMLMTPAVANLIRKKETNKIPSTIQTSRRIGMMALDDHLMELVKSGEITREAALSAAQNPGELADRI